MARPLTTSAGAPQAGHARAGRSSRRVAWRWGLLLTAGWLAQAGLRVWFGRGQVVPLANPDESAYLIAARVLAGGPGGNLSGSTLYQGGYPLLISPAYWLTRNPATVYHTVMVINAALSALIMPLGYLACRRLGLDRRMAYGAAMVAALVPAGFFYSGYAMSDAIFPVLTLAWLLAVHSWLTATSSRGWYAAAAGSALLSGFAYSVHSRGLVMLALFAVTGIVIGVRRLAPRGTVAVAAVTALVTAAAGWGLDRYLTRAIYPGGTRSLSGQLVSRLTSSDGVVHVIEMAGGQMWRLVLDSWDIAGIGLIAAVAAVVSRGLRPDLRIMAAISVALTVLIACVAPAALPPDQGQTWASGRYLDGMIVVFFLVGVVILVRARPRRILGYAAATTGLFVLAAVTVAIYAGNSLPVSWFGNAFNFAEPAVLAGNWTQVSVLVATAVTLGLLGCWVLLALAARRGAGLARLGLGALGLGLAAVSLVALAQMTSHVSQAATSAEAANTTGWLTATRLKPGDKLGIAIDVSWPVWVEQSFEVTWTQPVLFNPADQPTPAGMTVVERLWTTGQSASASWPQHPAGWRIVASDRTDGWVAWRKP